MCHQPSDVCMTHNVGTVQIYIDLTCTERIVIRGAAELQRRRFVHDRPSQCAWELLNVKKHWMSAEIVAYLLLFSPCLCR